MKTVNLDRLFDGMTDHGEDRQLILALAAGQLALQSLRAGRTALEKSDKGMVPAVRDNIDAIQFFADAITMVTGQRAPQELVQALHERRPRRQPNAASNRTWPVQVGGYWLRLMLDCLDAYNGWMQTVMPVPAVVVASISLTLLAREMDTLLMGADYSAGDLTPFLEWASVRRGDGADMAIRVTRRGD